AAQRRDHFVDSAPRVEDKRQVELARQLELAAKVHSLSFGIEAFDVEVQAALADGNRTFALDPHSQLVEVFRPMIREKHRMQAVSRIEAGLGTAQITQLREAGDADCRNDLMRHARCARAREHLGAIGVEFGDVEMRVAVEQFHLYRISQRAMPRNKPMLTTSVAVVRKMLDAIAGSAP